MTGGRLAGSVVDGYADRRAGVPLRLVPVLLCLPLLFTFEFGAFTAQSPSVFYRLEVGAGFRLVDIVILGLAGVQILLAPRARIALRFPVSLALPLCLAVVAWAISVVFGYLSGGTQLLYDWRSIVLGVIVALMTATGVRDRTDSRILIDALLLISAAFSVYALADFAAGGGVRTGATGRIPLWDQHALTVLSFSAVVAIARWLLHTSRRGMALVCGAPCVLVVLLAARRNSWGELLFGLGFLLVLEGGVRRRLQALGLTALFAAVVVVAMGPGRLITRVQSIDPRASGTPESVTNAGHVGDVLDAWDVIKTSPILGIGQGKPYQTSRIRNWKAESWMVHNAPLHVWLRYGLLGLVAYLWWHFAYFRYLGRLRRRWRAFPDVESRGMAALFLATLCWSVAVFSVGLFFSEWSYTSLQRMVLIAVLWGLTLHRSARHPPAELPPYKLKPMQQPSSAIA